MVRSTKTISKQCQCCNFYYFVIRNFKHHKYVCDGCFFCTMYEKDSKGVLTIWIIKTTKGSFRTVSSYFYKEVEESLEKTDLSDKYGWIYWTFTTLLYVTTSARGAFWRSYCLKLPVYEKDSKGVLTLQRQVWLDILNFYYFVVGNYVCKGCFLKKLLFKIAGIQKGQQRSINSSTTESTAVSRIGSRIGRIGSSFQNRQQNRQNRQQFPESAAA